MEISGMRPTDPSFEESDVGIKKVINKKCVIIWMCCWIVGLILVFTYQTYQYQSSQILDPILYLGDRDTQLSHVSYSVNRQDARKVEHRIIPSKVVVIKRPYNQDVHCKNFTKRLFDVGTFNTTALVSYPGSGNTWTRHLLELASGIYTGSVYLDIDLLARGFLGEKEQWDSGSTIVQKMHFQYKKGSPVSKAILIIRDPYKAIVSFVQYLESGHTGQASPHTFHKKEWSPYILGETFKWISLSKSWIEAPVITLVVHYEELRRNISAELGRICQFLDITCSNLNSTCFHNHQEGSFHRRRKLLLEPEFPSWVREKVDIGIDYLSNLLRKHGYKPLPTQYYPYYRNQTKNIPEEKAI